MTEKVFLPGPPCFHTWRWLSIKNSICTKDWPSHTNFEHTMFLHRRKSGQKNSGEHFPQSQLNALHYFTNMKTSWEQQDFTLRFISYSHLSALDFFSFTIWINKYETYHLMIFLWQFWHLFGGSLSSCIMSQNNSNKILKKNPDQHFAFWKNNLFTYRRF